MNADSFFQFFDLLAEAPNSVSKLRDLILQLALQGKLVPQDPNDKPISQAPIDSINGKETSTDDNDNPSEARPFAVPTNWRWIRLRDVPVALKYGTSVKCGYASNGVPVLRIPNVVGGQIDLEDLKYGPLSDKEQTDLRLEQGDLLLIRSNGSTGIVGRTAVVDINAVGFAYAGYLVRLRFPMTIWYPEFFHLAMISQATRNQIEGPIRTTSGVKNINSTEIGRLMVPLPPLAEQRRIVSKVDELLGLCDELETRQGARRELRERLVQAALDQLLASRDPAEFATHWQRLQTHFDILFDTPEALGKLQDAVIELAVKGTLVAPDESDQRAQELVKQLRIERQKLEDAGAIPKSKPVPEIQIDGLPFEVPPAWQWVRLGDLTSHIEYGTSQKASSASNSSTPIPVLRMNNIKDGKISVQNLKYVSPTIDDLPKLYLEPNDILFNRTNSFELVGKAGVFKKQADKFTFASYLIRVRILNQVSADFVNYVINSPFFRRTQIEPDVTQQCGQANFNGTKLRTTLVPLPPANEQKRIVTKIEELFAHCERLEASLIKRNSSGDSLLDQSIRVLLLSEPKSSGSSSHASAEKTAKDRSSAS